MRRRLTAIYRRLAQLYQDGGDAFRSFHRVSEAASRYSLQKAQESIEKIGLAMPPLAQLPDSSLKKTAIVTTSKTLTFVLEITVTTYRESLYVQGIVFAYIRAAYADNPQFWGEAIKKKLLKDAIDLILGSTAPFAPFVVKFVRYGEEALLAQQKTRHSADEYLAYLDERCRKIEDITATVREIQHGLESAQDQLKKKLAEVEKNASDH